MLRELLGDPAAGLQQQIELRGGQRMRLQVEQAHRADQLACQTRSAESSQRRARRVRGLQADAEQRVLRDVRDHERLARAARPAAARARNATLPDGSSSLRWPTILRPIAQLDGKEDHRAAKRLGRPGHDLVKQVVFARAGARVGRRLSRRVRAFCRSPRLMLSAGWFLSATSAMPSVERKFRAAARRALCAEKTRMALRSGGDRRRSSAITEKPSAWGSERSQMSRTWRAARLEDPGGSGTVTDEHGLDRVAFDRLTVDRRLLGVEFGDENVWRHVNELLADANVCAIRGPQKMCNFASVLT